ncbi:MAG: glycosyltransferase family 1 protein [Ginsengibacter sp.]
MIKHLRIGIDVRLLTYRRGIGNYVYNLLQELSKIDEQNEYILYGNNKKAARFIPDNPRFKFEVIGPALYPLWEQIVLPYHVKRDKIDVLHCPANAGPLWLTGKTKLVITIHDIMYMLPRSILSSSPSLYQNLGRKYLKWVVPTVAKRAAKVITISNYSKSDILKHIPINKNKIHVIYEAPGPNFRELNVLSKQDSIKRFGLSPLYILSFGALDPRKNTALVIEAFSKFRLKSKSSHQLVIVGLSEMQKQYFLKQITTLGISSSVILLGFVSEEELVALYNGAYLLLYPSLYEGFGFPILEAMACGTPVISSAVTSIPEIAGEAAILVNPTDIEAIAEAIHRLTKDKPFREKLILMGYSRASEFSWAKAAKESLEVYTKIGNDLN